MTTSYFIFSKRKDGNIADNSENQFIILEPRNTYFLPRCILDYYTNNGLFENRLIEWCKQFCSIHILLILGHIRVHIQTH